MPNRYYPEIVKLRGGPQESKSKQAYVITVPAYIGNKLAEKGITYFKVSLTDKGILYEPTVHPNEQEVPEWLK